MGLVEEMMGLKVGEDWEDFAENALLFRLGVRGRGKDDEGEGSVIDEEGVQCGVVQIGDHVHASSPASSKHAANGKNAGMVECLKD